MLVIAASDASKVYGEPLPVLAVTYSGFVNGDTTNNLTSPAVLSTSATATSPPGAYPIHVSGAAGSNYAITFVDGTLTVRPAVTTGLLTSSANPALPGQPVTFTFTIDVVAPGVGLPTGTVQFKTDGTNAGAPVALSGGVASYTNSDPRPRLARGRSRLRGRRELQRHDRLYFPVSQYPAGGKSRRRRAGSDQRHFGRDRYAPEQRHGRR